MSMYGYDVSYYDYGFSDQAITNSFYGNSISPMAAAIDYDDEIYSRRRPPLRQKPPSQNPSSPPEHRHDGGSPLPLGMDWSPPPHIWEGRNSVWPHDSQKKWSYCVTIPSWTITPSASGSDTVFFSLQVGIQSPEGFTTTRSVPRRFNEFLKLYSELKKEFPKKDLPSPPPRRLMKIRSKTLLEERRCELEGWMQKLLSDINVSRTVLVAIFLELEAAARQACSELTQDDSAANSGESDQISSGSNLGLTSSDDDIEELQRKCIELELRLTIEQEARAYAESMNKTTIEQNEILQKEFNEAKEQIVNLRKQNDEVELKLTSHSDLKQELNKCLKDKVDLEKEKQKLEAENVSKVAFLHEFKLVHNRLRECNINLLDEEDNLMADTSLSDAIDLLESSDNQITLLLDEAQQLIGQDAETATTVANEDDKSDTLINKDKDELKILLGDILMENMKLRKQVNSVIRNALIKHDNAPKDDDDGAMKNASNKFVD